MILESTKIIEKEILLKTGEACENLVIDIMKSELTKHICESIGKGESLAIGPIETRPCEQTDERVKYRAYMRVDPIVYCKDCWKRPYDNCPMEWYWFDHEADDFCFCKYGEREMPPYEEGEENDTNH